MFHDSAFNFARRCSRRLRLSAGRTLKQPKSRGVCSELTALFRVELEPQRQWVRSHLVFHPGVTHPVGWIPGAEMRMFYALSDVVPTQAMP